MCRLVVKIVRTSSCSFSAALVQQPQNFAVPLQVCCSYIQYRYRVYIESGAAVAGAAVLSVTAATWGTIIGFGN